MLFSTATGIVFCLSGDSIGAAPPPAQVPNPSISPSSPCFVVLTQPVKVKIAYGETVLPAGMKLPVVSSDATSIRVKNMGELQTIPIAATILGLPHSVPSRVPVATPGFPKNSLYYIGYDGAFEGRFNRIYLVTDIANKVVAVQLVDEHPKGRWKSAAALAAASWSTYNFVNARMRASDAMRVQAGSKRQGNVIPIETQLYQRVRTRAGRKNVDRYEEQETAKLFLPIPFARIILHCAQIELSKP